MKEKEMLNKVEQNADVTRAMGKLKKERAEVNINPKMYLLEFTKTELGKMAKVDTKDFNTEEKEIFEQTKKNYETNLAEYEKARLEGIMVPLKYSDLQVVKNGVLEALTYNQEFGWDDNVRMKAMIREEHTLTVYLSLRKKDDITKRYYGSLEEIAKEMEKTIEALYNVYLENFVLTDNERKNS